MGVCLKYGYSRFHRVTELSAIGAFATFAAGLTWRLAVTIDAAADWLILGISVPVGYALADLVSGIVHWLADRYGTTSTPIVGSNFIRPFREHHVDPKAITTHDFVETNGSNCIVSAPCMAIVFFGLPITESVLATFVVAGMLVFCLTIFATNQFHKWAHMDSPPRAVSWLRRLSLALTSEHHDIHHNAPFDRNYCITVGWWNPILERLKVFEKVESGIAFISGIRPAEAPPSSPPVESCPIGTLQFDQDLKEVI